MDTMEIILHPFSFFILIGILYIFYEKIEEHSKNIDYYKNKNLPATAKAEEIDLKLCK